MGLGMSLPETAEDPPWAFAFIQHIKNTKISEDKNLYQMQWIMYAHI